MSATSPDFADGGRVDDDAREITPAASAIATDADDALPSAAGARASARRFVRDVEACVDFVKMARRADDGRDWRRQYCRELREFVDFLSEDASRQSAGALAPEAAPGFWPHTVCAHAAVTGDLPLLAWARSHRLAWDGAVLECAFARRDLAMLEFACENGLAWDGVTPRTPGTRGDFYRAVHRHAANRGADSPSRGDRRNRDDIWRRLTKAHRSFRRLSALRDDDDDDDAD